MARCASCHKCSTVFWQISVSGQRLKKILKNLEFIIPIIYKLANVSSSHLSCHQNCSKVVEQAHLLCNQRSIHHGVHIKDGAGRGPAIEPAVGADSLAMLE